MDFKKKLRKYLIDRHLLVTATQFWYVHADLWYNAVCI